MTVEHTYGGLQAEDYGVLKAIRELFQTNNQSPQAVLEYVRDTFRAAQAKPIDCSKNDQKNEQFCLLPLIPSVISFADFTTNRRKQSFCRFGTLDASRFGNEKTPK